MRFGSYAAAYALGFLLCATASAQATTPAAPANTEPALATGQFASKETNVGDIQVSLVKVIRDGDKLTVNVRFRPLTAGGYKYPETIYDEKMSDKEWERNFYLTSGNKKYLVLKDADGKWLAPEKLTLYGGGGSWSATFPAPPSGQNAVLHMLKLEALGPFIVP